MDVKFERTIQLRERIPVESVVVGECGIAVRFDAEVSESNGVRALRKGESLIRQSDVELAVLELLSPRTA